MKHIEWALKSYPSPEKGNNLCTRSPYSNPQMCNLPLAGVLAQFETHKEMTSSDDVRLLSLIESSHAGDVFASVSDYLRPFSTLQSTSRKGDPALNLRSLGKQFLPFLNKSISILPKRLSNPDEEYRDSARDLFRAYELCLDCLESFSAQLACKPHTVQLQRLRMVYCLDAWGFHESVSTQAFKVLEKLRGSDASSRLLPEVKDGEAELAMVVVEAVTAIFKAVAMSQQRDDKMYRKVVLLLGEVRAWFRSVWDYYYYYRSVLLPFKKF